MKRPKRQFPFKPFFIGAMGILGSSIFLFGYASTVKIPEVPDRTQIPQNGPSRIQLTLTQERTLNLALDQVREREIAVKIETAGQVQAIDSLMSHNYAPVMGQVISVPVVVGQTIHQGQLLARLRSDQLGQLQSDLLQEAMQIQADIKQTQVQLNFSKVNYDRETKLFNERISPKADMEAAKAQYEKDQGILQSLKEKREALIANYQSRLALYGADRNVVTKIIQQKKIEPYVSIIASRDGVLTNRNANPGELVEMSKELFTVADLSRVWLTGNIYEKDIASINYLHQPVWVKLDSLPNRIFKGAVSFIGAMLDPQTRTLEIRSEVLNPDLLLKPNMFARVEIQTGKQKVMSVPNTAIQRSGDYNFAYVASDDHQYIEKQVVTGITDGTFTEIKEGLQLGERIVVKGTIGLKGEVQKLQPTSKS